MVEQTHAELLWGNHWREHDTVQIKYNIRYHALIQGDSGRAKIIFWYVFVPLIFRVSGRQYRQVFVQVKDHKCNQCWHWWGLGIFASLVQMYCGGRQKWWGNIRNHWDWGSLEAKYQ